MDTETLIIESAERIFSDHVDKALLDKCEQGAFAEALWQQIVDQGFHLLGSPDSGTEAADLFAFLKICGRFAVPLPMAEVLLANRWMAAKDSVLRSIGIQHNGGVIDIAWSSHAEWILAVSPDSRIVELHPGQAAQEGLANLAGEPRGSIAPPALVQGMLEVEDAPYAQLALARTCLMAGTLQAVLDLGLQFASERLQFERTISKFQAIQHSLAVVAAEVAAAQRAADAGIDALSSERFLYEVAAAKARVGEAVGIVAEQVHQVHGAMGFTYEHRLHHFTRRLWAWRDEWGSEFYWQQILGQQFAALGADRAWDFIATKG